jgi:thymidylate synthase
VAPGPVITEYARPTERVLSWGKRDANPFFHLMESLWMLAGRNDVGFVAEFAKQMKEYSDDGVRLNGAYGYRWRRHFGFDQLVHLIELLKSEPTTRRAVLQIYDPSSDTAQGRDIPCNTVAYFDIVNDELNMTVCNRSNDIVWGCYGANAVHFSMLQEFMAIHIGVDIGRYRQFSNNFHIYEPHWPLMEEYWKVPESYEFRIIPLLRERIPYDIHMRDIDLFLRDPISFIPETEFLRDVAQPMARAFLYRKMGHGSGLHFLHEADTNNDWIQAGIQWLLRRDDAGTHSKAA